MQLKKKAKVLNIILIRCKETCDKLLKVIVQVIVNVNNNAAAAKSLQPCPTPFDPRDSSPPGSPIPGILQTRTLEWVAISFSNA